MAEFYGKTVEEAIEDGLKTLGIKRENAEIEVLEEPSKGFLGFNSKKAKVSVTEKVVLSDGERAVEFLDGLLSLMDVNAKCKVIDENEKVVIEVIAENSPAVIGYRGEVLDALQNLAGAVANKGRDDYRRVVVDCEGYRNKREETLKDLANKLAAKAVRTGRKVVLEPMNPYERRILHATLTGNTEVKTQSEGKEPNRYVVIIPNNLKPYDESEDRPIREGKRYGGGKFRDGGRRDGDRRGGRGGRDRAPSQPRPKTSGFGTFLGNSLKNDNK